jgi:hypothetical protein
MWMKKYHHIIGEKKARSGHKFWILRNVELTKETKWHPFLKIVKFLMHTTIVEE